MSKSRLGDRKLRRLRAATGRPDIVKALVRGGWPHWLALVVFEDGSYAEVNRHTGEVFPGDPVAMVNARLRLVEAGWSSQRAEQFVDAWAEAEGRVGNRHDPP